METSASRNRQVLQRRLGKRVRVRSVQEVAKLLALPASRVRQLETQALRKLRNGAVPAFATDYNGWDEV